MKYQYDVFADYFHFSLEDDGIKPPVGIVWQRQAIEDMLLVGDDYLLVGTVRNMDVPVTIEVVDTDPQPNYLDTLRAGADHVTECSLNIQSGKLVILGNEYYPDAPRIPVAPNTYEVRVFYFNLDKISDDGLDGEDTYHVVLFPGHPIAPRVLKRWQALEDNG